MSQDNITYSTVKGEDLVAAMTASKKATVAGRTVKKNDSVVWDQTVTILMERVDISKLHRGTDKESTKKNGKVLKEILANHVQATVVIPEKGKNRSGKEFTIDNGNGPQWSSWEETRRMWDYAGTVAKVIAFSQESLLYPEQYKVAARCDILKKCVAKEEPIAAVRRLSNDLQGALDNMSEQADVLEAHKLTSALTVNNLDITLEMRDLIAQLGALLDLADDTEKAVIQPDLLNMAVKHFE